MALPSRPVRKAAQVSPSQQATPKSGGVPMPGHRSAQPFGSVSKGEYKRPAAPVSPKSLPVNDKDAGSDARKYR